MPAGGGNPKVPPIWTWPGYPSTWPGGVPPQLDLAGVHPLWTDRQMDGWTDTCQNITFPRTTYAVGKNCNITHLQVNSILLSFLLRPMQTYLYLFFFCSHAVDFSTSIATQIIALTALWMTFIYSDSRTVFIVPPAMVICSPISRPASCRVIKSLWEWAMWCFYIREI